MTEQTKEKISEIMAKLYDLTFGVKVDPADVMIVNIFYDPQFYVTCFSYLVDNNFVVFYRGDESEGTHGVSIDLMYLYTTELAGQLKEDDVYYEGSKLAFLIPLSPLGLPMREETYEQSRFSSVQGPSKQELEELDISPEYTVVSLNQNPRIQELIELIVTVVQKEAE